MKLEDHTGKYLRSEVNACIYLRSHVKTGIYLKSYDKKGIYLKSEVKIDEHRCTPWLQ